MVVEGGSEGKYVAACHQRYGDSLALHQYVLTTNFTKDTPSLRLGEYRTEYWEECLSKWGMS